VLSGTFSGPEETYGAVRCAAEAIDRRASGKRW